MGKKKLKTRLEEHSNCSKCKTGVMCPMLEADLSKLISPISIKAQSISYIDHMPAVGEEEPWERSMRDLVAKLKSYALPELYIAVMVLREIYNWGLKEISDELNMTGSKAVWYVNKRAKELLRERKYK